MHTLSPAFTATTWLDRVAALMAAGMITLSVLASLGAIADGQVDESLMAQALAATQLA